MRSILLILCTITGIYSFIDSTQELSVTKEVSIARDSLSHDSTVEYLIMPPSRELLRDVELVMPKQYKPLKSAGLSALIPGAGQFYCQRKGRSIMFLIVASLSAVTTANRWYFYNHNYSDAVITNQIEVDSTFENLQKFTPDLDAYKQSYKAYMDARMRLDFTKYSKKQGRYVGRQGIGFTVGIYLWNVFDAIGCSNHYYDLESKNPAKAAWLAAIPFLGLGQIYNRSFGKAGLIWTTQTMLAYMALNYNILMNDCLHKRSQVKNTKTLDHATVMSHYEKWSYEYDNVNRKRNTYLWYFILFYFYGIFDSAVDAHLHDFKLKIKLQPGLEKSKESVSLNFKVDF